MAIVQTLPVFFALVLVVLARVQFVAALLQTRFRAKSPAATAFVALAHAVPMAEVQLAELFALLGLLSCHYAARESGRGNVYLSDLAVIHFPCKMIFAAASIFSPAAVTRVLLSASKQGSPLTLIAIVADAAANVLHCIFLAGYVGDAAVTTNVVIVALLAHRFVLSRALVSRGVAALGNATGEGKMAASLRAKGENSYYFAHQRTSPAAHVVTNGLPQPVAAPSQAAFQRLPTPPPLQKSALAAVDSYAFADLGATVRVDIAVAAFELDAPDAITAGALQDALRWTPTSVRLALGRREFSVARLFDAIASASAVVTAKRKVRIEMRKATGNDRSWPALHAPARTDADDDDDAD